MGTTIVKFNQVSIGATTACNDCSSFGVVCNDVLSTPASPCSREPLVVPASPCIDEALVKLESAPCCVRRFP